MGREVIVVRERSERVRERERGRGRRENMFEVDGWMGDCCCVV